MGSPVSVIVSGQEGEDRGGVRGYVNGIDTGGVRRDQKVM
jgi:hypothetical protein